MATRVEKKMKSQFSLKMEKLSQSVSSSDVQTG